MINNYYTANRCYCQLLICPSLRNDTQQGSLNTSFAGAFLLFGIWYDGKVFFAANMHN